MKKDFAGEGMKEELISSSIHDMSEEAKNAGIRR
jgi:hypothetical protein